MLEAIFLQFAAIYGFFLNEDPFLGQVVSTTPFCPLSGALACYRRFGELLRIVIQREIWQRA